MQCIKSAIILGLSLAAPMLMAQPFIQQQVAGFYVQPLGKFQVTALYDGYVKVPSTVFHGMDQKKVQSILNDHFIDHASGIQTSVNAYLVNTGEQLILIDSGAAQCFGGTLGSIEKNMRAAGYRAEQVDAILLTHLHADHACGISAVDGKKSFPNATVYANQQEADFWLNSDNLKKFPQQKQSLVKNSFAQMQKTIKPYQDSNQFKTYNIGDKIADGIRVVATYGHTVGHTSYMVESGQEKLLVLGDVVHNHALQFSHPEVSFVYDIDEAQAIKTRKAQFEQAARQGYLVAAAHLPYPGIGHIQKLENGQMTWLPIPFNSNIKPASAPKAAAKETATKTK